MQSFEDAVGRQIELTDERYAHICRYHADAVPFLDRMAEVLRAPDAQRQSTQDAAVRVFYKYFADILGGKYLAVVVKIAERRFVLTAYLTRRIQTGRPG